MGSSVSAFEESGKNLVLRRVHNGLVGGTKRRRTDVSYTPKVICSLEAGLRKCIVDKNNTCKTGDKMCFKDKNACNIGCKDKLEPRPLIDAFKKYSEGVQAAAKMSDNLRTNVEFQNIDSLTPGSILKRLASGKKRLQEQETINTKRQKAIIKALNDNATCKELVVQVIKAEKRQGPTITERELQDILGSVIGMVATKKQIRSIYLQQQFINEVFNKKFSYRPPPPHILITGPPGVGKTTIANKLGIIFKGLGVCNNDTVLEVQASDLIGGYVGSTALKTNQKIIEAWGGCLFIDEAYQLADSKFGIEAVNECMKYMTRMFPVPGNLRSEDAPIFIFAGYEWNMTNKKCGFLSINPGLDRRIPTQYRINIPAFAATTIRDIFMVKIKSYVTFEGDWHPGDVALKHITDLGEGRTANINGGYANVMVSAVVQYLAEKYEAVKKNTTEMKKILSMNKIDLLEALKLPKPPTAPDAIINECKNN